MLVDCWRKNQPTYFCCSACLVGKFNSICDNDKLLNIAHGRLDNEQTSDNTKLLQLGENVFGDGPICPHPSECLWTHLNIFPSLNKATNTRDDYVTQPNNTHMDETHPKPS